MKMSKKPVRQMKNVQEVTGATPRAYQNIPSNKDAQKTRGGGGTIRTKPGKIPNK